MTLIDLKAMKCKTCGEPLDIGKAQGGVIKCAICDSVFTLPKVDASQKVLDFLSQGEHDLDTCRFEDAYSAFNKACELDKTEPEAYWGMALAEFKIQYLKDEVNNRLQPICHEISDKDFADSSNFLKAIRYATEAQKTEYERKAEEINYIKNEFNKIAKTGAKYDCFICVKVTDENGGRTQDYKHADDIYFELKGKGYKPFFSERELVGVTGADYEARILYALKSAECMLVICFDEAYLRTKWVKNEYTRFLKLVNDEEKESDSIALVFGNRPVEKLPGKKGKIQGIALNSLTAMERIVSFVDSHTPEARKRREEALRAKEEEAKRKESENEDLRNQLAELKQMFLNQQDSKASALEAELKKKNEELEKKTAENGLLNSLVELQSTVKEVTAPKPAPSNGVPVTASSDLKDFEIENGVLKKYKGNAVNVTIPSGIKVIGDNAFKGCDGVQSVIIPEGVTAIGTFAFARLANLQRVTVPSTLTDCQNAFDYCTAIQYNEYDQCAYLGNSLNPYHLLVKTLNRDLVSCRVHGGAKVIAKYAFCMLRKFERITLPVGLEYICNNAFYSCGILKSATIPSTVKVIGEKAFESCEALTSINIPDSVTYIGKGAFSRVICSGNPKVTLSIKGQTHTVTSELEWERLFEGLTPKEAAPAESTASEFEIEGGALKKYNGNAKKVTVPSVSEILSSAFSDKGSIEQIILPSGIKKIGSHAFSRCLRLKSINIPNGVTEIGGMAFSGCISLQELVIPQSVTTINTLPFDECTGLKRLTLPTKFSGNTFLLLNDSTKNCNITYRDVLAPTASANTASAPKSAPKAAATVPEKENSDKDFTIEWGVLRKYSGGKVHVVIPDGVTAIGRHAFIYSKVKSVKIPASVRGIDSWAFFHCNELKSIVIPKTVEGVYKFAFEGCANLETIYCEAPYQPARWEKNWDKKENKLFAGKYNVVWNYKGN